MEAPVVVLWSRNKKIRGENVFPWQEFLGLILQGQFAAVFDPTFLLVLALVAFMYRRLQRDQLQMFGVLGYHLWQQVLAAAFYGIVGGIIGSVILGVVGVTVNHLGLNYIWPVAIALMLVNMRFMCFAYAGGLVALSNLLFGWPVVNVPQVLALVAGLHITESFLIFISGRYSAVPLMLRREDGRGVGAFNLQNFWPLPLVMLGAVGIPETTQLQGISMPDWWPLLPIGEELPTGQTWLYGMLPVAAALGYADLAVASSPAERRRASAAHLALYSITLMGLTLLSVKYNWLQFVAALVSPLGHELLIQLDNRREMQGEPRFVPPPEGVMVLDTVTGSPARKMGLRPGDILLELGGMHIDNGYELARAISYAPEIFEATIGRAGRVERHQGRFLGGERRLGVILVPDGYSTSYAEVTRRYGLLDWLRSWVLRRLKK